MSSNEAKGNSDATLNLATLKESLARKERRNKVKTGDWVKCKGEGKALWVYGWIKSIRITSVGVRVLVDRGYLPQQWFDEGELSPAFEIQAPEEVAQLRNVLHKIGKEAR